MLTISVANDGTKTYTVLKGIKKATKAARGKSGEDKLKYPFLLTMEDDDCIVVDTKEEAQKMQRSANQEPYRLSTSVSKAITLADYPDADPSNVGKFFFFRNGKLETKKPKA